MTKPAAQRRVLAGHSGARLTLMETPACSLVRKSAGQAADNARLRAQCEKLRRLHAAGLPCPAVLAEHEAEGVFCFDMDYVPADSLAHLIISGRAAPWEAIIPQILQLVSHFQSTTTGEIPASAFLSKLDIMLALCAQGQHTASFTTALTEITQRLRGLDWTGIPQSDCHGDMTLENMLLRQDRKLVFIDFDVPEHCSWLLDVAKMYQDILGHWCLRETALADPYGMKTVNAQMALARLASLLAPAMGALIPRFRPLLCQLACFHLFRTLPYARNAHIPAYVVQRMTALLGMI